MQKEYGVRGDDKDILLAAIADGVQTILGVLSGEKVDTSLLASFYEDGLRPVRKPAEGTYSAATFETTEDFIEARYGRRN
ncbi:MAG: hypothetical protein Q4C18_05260 [Eubacteriales bacterium]|nr:hypothetical protein [Eubacteriales bacterium]